MARPKSRADELSASNEPWLGTKESAALLGVSVSTIQKMVEAGKLRAWRTQGGHRRVAEADVRALKRDHQPRSGGAVNKMLLVLVVEDNPTMVKTYEKIAVQWGPHVDVSFAGDAAAALLAIGQKRPDVVIADLVMQPLDGFHLIRTLRASPELASTRVLVVTALSDKEIEARGGLDEQTLVYRKPLPFERLAGYIEARVQDRLHRT